jgi:hypothetical protein
MHACPSLTPHPRIRGPPRLDVPHLQLPLCPLPRQPARHEHRHLRARATPPRSSHPRLTAAQGTVIVIAGVIGIVAFGSINSGLDDDTSVAQLTRLQGGAPAGSASSSSSPSRWCCCTCSSRRSTRSSPRARTSPPRRSAHDDAGPHRRPRGAGRGHGGTRQTGTLRSASRRGRRRRTTS